MTKKQFLVFGSVSTRAINNIKKFPMEKKPGTIRIGCFGDSFTMGEEVVSEYSYPSFLQNLFTENKQNVEVINFGNSWYGFQQSIFMYDYVGKKFNLDYVIFGPSGFFEERDSRFNHTEDINPTYVHGRYILEDSKVKLLEPIGDSFKSRFDNYYSFIPKWQYLKYDRGIPAVLKAVLPEGRTMENYFYYMKDKSEKDESLTIASHLLSRINSEKKVLLFNNRKDLVDTAKSVGVESYYLDGSQITAFDKDVQYKFPYYRITHYGPNLNYEFARYVYEVISGKQKYTSKKIIFSEIENNKLNADLSINNIKNVKVEIAGVEFGELMEVSNRYETPHLEPVDINKIFNESKSLVIVKAKNKSIIHGRAFPVNFLLNENQPIFLSSHKDGSQKVLLGALNVFEKSNIGILKDKLSIINIDGANFGQFFIENKFVPESLKKQFNVFLYIGDHLFLSGEKVKGGILFEKPPIAPWLIRASEDSFLNTDSISTSGVANLKISRIKGDPILLPVARWHIEEQKSKMSRFSKPILRRKDKEFSRARE